MRAHGVVVLLLCCVCGGDPVGPDPGQAARIDALEGRVTALEAAVERVAVQRAVLPTVEMTAAESSAPVGPLVRVAIGPTMIAVDGRRVESGDLERVLKDKRVDGGLRVAVEAEAGVSQSAVVGVLDVVKKVGGHVAITAHKGAPGTGTGTGTGTEPASPATAR